jgi:hypothetical protein
MHLKYSRQKAGKIMAKEKLVMVMDDTVNIGKEPYQFRDEQEKKDFDAMLDRYRKEYNL